jgi:hypothetical protein
VTPVSILSNFEDRIGNAVEGAFAGVFRSPVQPVELARSLAKAMDDGRSIGVGKVYAPLGYTVALSPEDDEKFGAFTATLAGELATYLGDHAREHGYHLTGTPHVSFTVHDDLRLGRFRVSAELAAPELAEPVGDPESAGLPESAGEPEVFDWQEPAESVSSLATVTVGDLGHDVALRGEAIVVGRLASSGIRLADANVSREHAAFVRDEDGWAIEDLGSTNGTLLNGQPVSRTHLNDGDVIEIGLTRLTYHESGR